MKPIWQITITISLSLLLELIMRIYRLPFFPIWIPLILLIESNRSIDWIILLGYGLLLLLAVTLYFGIESLDFSLSLLITSLLYSRLIKRNLLYLLITASSLWYIFSWVVGNLPTGSFYFEIFFTALFTRIAYYEYLSAFLSRLFLVGLTLSLVYPIRTVNKLIGGYCFANRLSH